MLAVLGLPLFLLVVWFGGQDRAPSATADVSIDSNHVSALRKLVVAKMTELGATKSGEVTSFEDGGSSRLTFNVPPRRLEEALDALDQAGGKVTETKVQLDDLSSEADSISSSLDGVGGCLGSIAAHLDGAVISPAVRAAANKDLASCREQITAVTERMDASPESAQDARVNVTISEPSTTSPILIAAVTLLAIALAAMAYLTVRSTRLDVIDVTDDHTSKPLAHLNEPGRWN